MGNNKKEIIIKGTKYTLDFFNEKRGYVGQNDSGEKVISIQANQTKYELQKTIYHELLHGYFHECGLPVFADNEYLITFLEETLYEILDNLSIATELYKKEYKI